MSNPYDQYDDTQLILRYVKLCEDYHKHCYLPLLKGKTVLKTSDVAIKIDKVVLECYRRGLMGPNGEESKLSLEDRNKEIKKGLELLKKECAELKDFKSDFIEGPFSETLTPKAKSLRPWQHLSGYHSLIEYQKAEEIEKAIEEVKSRYEEMRITACQEENEYYNSL